MIPTLYEPFRHWSEKGSVYILSDLHFDDADCKFMSPDWITPQEQIAIINGMVMKNDTFICLGDVGSPEYIEDIKARKKILILGNHDAKGAYKNYFDEIYTGPLFIAEKILLSHEPVYGLQWCLNIHGHDHNNIEPYKEGCKHINLAVWISTKRAKTIYYDEEGNELESILVFLKQKIPAEEEIIEYEVNEGDTSDYWLATAANALRPLYQLLTLAKMRPDCVWDGD